MGGEREPGGRGGAVTPEGAQAQVQRKAVQRSPGRQTLVERELARGPIQRQATGAAPRLDDPAVTGAIGDRGGGAPLPAENRRDLEGQFGVDLSRARVHTDEQAASAADALGARAFTHGEHISFAQGAYDPAATDGRKLIAHEVAHVVQGYEGRTQGLHADVSDPSSPLEREAEAAAEAHRGSAHDGPIAPAPAAIRATGTIHRDKDDNAGSTKGPDAGASEQHGDTLFVPTTYKVTWDDARQAAVDPAKAADLDLDWIDSLDSHLYGGIASLDGAFSQHDQDVDFWHYFEKSAGYGDYVDAKQRNEAEKQTREAKWKADNKALYDAAVARLEAAGKKPKRPSRVKDAVAKEPQYLDDWKKLKEQYDDDLAALGLKLKVEVADLTADEREAFAAIPVDYRAPTRSVVDVPEGTEKVTWAEGRTLARMNFVAWGINIFGDVDKLKDHFLKIRPVSGGGGLYLHEAAAVRYEQARAWFHEKNPAYTFYGTTIGQALRNRHQSSESRGKLGHPLGLSLDIQAVKNPHQMDPVAQLMLREFGRPTNEEGEDEQGENKLEVPDYTYAAAKRIGRKSAAGEDLSDDEEATLESVDAAFGKMVATSKAFQSSIGEDQMKELEEKQVLYFQKIVPVNKKIIALKKQQKRAIDRGAKRILKENRDARRTDKSIEKMTKEQALEEAQAWDDGVIAIQEQIDALEESIQEVKDEVMATVSTVFAPWIEKLEAKIEGIKAGTEGKRPLGDPDAFDTVVNEKLLARAKAEVTSAKKRKNLKKLQKILNTKKYAPFFADLLGSEDADREVEGADTEGAAADGQGEDEAPKPKPETSRQRRAREKREAVALGSRMLEQLATFENIVYEQGEAGAYEQLLERFTNPDYMYKIFGSRDEAKANPKSRRGKPAKPPRYVMKKTVREPSVMQYLEEGFVMSDDMEKGKELEKGERREAVFNAEFVKCMMRFGFYPLAAVSAVDSMHFDFVEGYGAIKEGGTKFSPKGVIVDKRKRSGK